MAHEKVAKEQPANTSLRASLTSAVADILRIPQDRSARIRKIAALAALPALIVLPVILLGWLSATQSPLQPQPVTLSDALDALDHGDLGKARQIALRLRASSNVAHEDSGGITFILGAVAARESELVRPELQKLYHALAAQLLADSREIGFPHGYEAIAQFLLGRSFALTGQHDEAVPLLESALKQYPADATAIHRLLAVSYRRVASPQLPKAVEHARAYLKAPHLSAEQRNAAWIEVSELLYQMGEHAECTRALDQVAADADGYGHVLVIRAQMLMAEALLVQKQNGSAPAPDPSVDPVANYQSSLKILRDVQRVELELTRPVRQSMFLIGRCLAGLGDERAALDQFARTRQLLADDAEGLAAGLEEADLLLQLGSEDEALKAYCRVAGTATQPSDYDDALIPLASFRSRILAAYEHYLKAGRFDEALQLAAHLNSLLPEGRRLELMAQVQRAWGAALLNKAAKLVPAEAQPLTAEARKHLRDAGLLYRTYAQVQFTEHDYPEAVWNSAESFLDGHDYANAVTALHEYLKYELRRRRPRALLNLGEAYLSLGNLEKAVEALRECIEFYPRDVASYRARLISSKAHLELGDPAKAESLLLENLEGESLTPASKEWRESLFALGMLLYDEGRQQEAIQKLSEAVARYPDYPQAIEGHYTLAQAQRQVVNKIREKLSGENTATSRNALSKEIARLLESALAEYGHVQQMLVQRQQDSELTLLEKSLMRNCIFGQAATLLELGRFDEAVRTYSAATNRYQTEPEVLHAFVQMMHCYRRLGRETEARGSLAQAKIVLRRIRPDAEFLSTTNYSREEWLDVLTTLEKL